MATWRPPERIKYAPLDAPWPGASQIAASRLFQPIMVGTLRLASRTWVPAMVPWRATEDGEVTPAVLAWYERFARGRPAAMVVEATGVRDVASGPLLRISDDRFLPGLEKLTECVRRASGGETRLFIQIIDFLSIRRRPDPGKFFSRFLTVTARHREYLGMPDDAETGVRQRLAALSEAQLQQALSARELESLRLGFRERVTDTHIPAVRDLPATLPQVFAAAAERARRAGFDGVELHYAHAYTMASFLSALNTRNDGYGGAREHRIRLPLEVYAAVRSRTGSDFALGCRMLAEDCIESGSTVEDAAYFAERLAAAGMDFISLSRGGKFEDAAQPKIGEAAYPYTGRSGYECMPSYYSDAKGPFGRNVDASTRIRARIRAAGHATPVVLCGGIHHFNQAEAALQNGAADIVGLARQALADPDWFVKVRSGEGAKVRLCLYTNYCEALDQRHREVTCELWDRSNLDEPGIALSADGKRRLVAP
ncbi:MAG TPA: NADH:flavin oxidoreductase [Steroidobacteraceae bacterium]|jgi:2,4-dienoyl-CoA reductase-like NADH-dependent reductase (Old Yellow Enzyme family)|nr:NADH:flavin oxidoreductase [Steroidobacteraceae bacterium]